MRIGYIILGMNFIYAFMITCLFFIKKKVTNVETTLFKYLVVSNFIGLILEFFSGILIIYIDFNIYLTYFINKLHIANLVIWSTFFLLYVLYICFGYKKDKYNIKKIKNGLFIYLMILIVISFVLPISFYEDGTYIYSEGLVSNFLMLLSFFYYVLELVFVMKNIRKISLVKLTPMFILIIGMFFVIFIKIINPGLILLSTVTTVAVLVMYFTIENPDVKMIAALNEAKLSAEKANRAKSDFLSNMSHEIRTPLNAIVGFSDCILEEEDLETAKNDARDIKLASENLLEIVNGILDISKIEANKMEIVETDYDLVETLENVAKLVEPRIGDKPIEMIVKFAPDIPYMLHGDGGKVRQIVTNILTNAVKYTEEGRITFYVNCVNEDGHSRLVISVEDTGRGIKPEHIDQLFTKFQRLEEDKNTTLEGTGLGLAITKRFVEMLGGKIVVQSKYGEGSKFTVYLNQRIVMINRPSEAFSSNNNANKFDGGDLSKARVLVVDDNKINIKVALKLLSNFGITADSVDSGFDCIEKVKMGNIYDLILLDDMMPKMSGVETLKQLRESVIYKIPVVALTANAISGMKEKYLNEGFDDYISKPIDKNELYRVLTTYIQSKKEMVTEVENIEEKFIDYTGKCALIVDDNRVNIKIAVKMLEPYNFTIDTCLSGQECLDKVKVNNYDVIFMDYMMPEMDGIETLQHLKENSEFRAPVICLTADAVEGAREKFLDAGFDEYISKPIDRTLLDEAIKKFIKK